LALTRRALCAGLALAAVPARAQESSDFSDFLETLWPAARARGVSRATFTGAVAGLTPDPALMGTGVKQAEFERTIKAYIEDAVTAGRVTRGRAAAQRWRGELGVIEERFGVPAEIVLAIWGMETDFGRVHGEKDVVRSIATLAFARRNNAIFAEEFVAALVMLEQGLVTRARFKGSWAGAMGHPQFMPSSYLRHAVAYAGSGPADIWGSIPDALASIGNFLGKQGWTRALPWGCEARIPASFDWNSLKGPVRGFTGKGVAPLSPLPPSAEATLFLPAGASGPAFLLTANYWLIKQYNNSDSYALSVALLGERIAGRPGIAMRWPADFRLLSRTDRIRLQELLTARGFYDGRIDGRFGPASRDAIHRFQRAMGMRPADGYPSPAVLERLGRKP
jgi:lytic murein transglycosylase